MSDDAKPTVLLTGATGFLGSRLLRAMLREGCSVVALKRSRSDVSRISDLAGRITLLDVDGAVPRSAFERRHIDVVIHTATAFGRAGETLSEIVETNVLFPMRLLETAAEFKTAAFFNTDTFSAKGVELPAGLAEYTLTKKHFAQYGELFASRVPMRFVNVRIEQMYGPHDDPKKFVPSLVRALLANQPTFALTPGDQLRDFIFVDDVVAAYLTLLRSYRSLGSGFSCVDVGTGTAAPLADMARLAHRISGSKTVLQFGAIPHRDGELMASRADVEPLKRLGWSPAVSLEDGLTRTIEAARA